MNEDQRSLRCASTRICDIASGLKKPSRGLAFAMKRSNVYMWESELRSFFFIMTVGIPVVVGNIRQLLCESRGGRPYGSQSLIVLMVSVDVKRHLKKTSANFASAFLSFSSTSSVQFSSVQFSSTSGGFSELGKSLYYRHSIPVWQKYAQHQLEPG